MIPEDWIVVELKEASLIQTGKGTKRLESGQYEIIGANGLIGYSNEFIEEGEFVYTGRVGTIGLTNFYSGKPVWISDNVLYIKRKGITPIKLIYYALKRIDYSYLNVGSTQPLIKQSDLKKLKIALPKDSKEQKAIAKILSDLDEKIEVNRKMNEILEEIGQTLFKKWFVDFEFPNEKGKPYKLSGGEMVESELGEIPEGWEVKELQGFLDVQKGLSYKGKFLVDEGGLPMANLGTFKPLKGFKPGGIKFYNGDHKERHLVKQGDMLIANTDITQKRDVLGSPVIIPKNIGSNEVLFTHHTFAVRFKNNSLPKLFVYYLLQTSEYRDRARGFAIGTTVLALPKEAILELPFAFANEKLYDDFNKIVSPFFERMEINNEQIESLEQIRDRLLPKLMTGKIRVKL